MEAAVAEDTTEAEGVVIYSVRFRALVVDQDIQGEQE
jgi:hypothetical protein